MRLVSRTLCNSWHNLKQNGQITFVDNRSERKKTVLQGHYTLEGIAKEIKGAFKQYSEPLSTEINSPVGAMVIYNENNRNITFDETLAEFLGIDKKLLFITFVKQLKTPTSYFVHCDLVDTNRNLLNGKKSNLLAQVGIKGKAFEYTNYQTDEVTCLRAASTSEHVNSVTLLVKDENGELFNFQGQKLYFELMLV